MHWVQGWRNQGGPGGPVLPGPHKCQFLGGPGGPEKIQKGALLTHVQLFVVVFLLVSVVIKYFIPRFVIAHRPKSACGPSLSIWTSSEYVNLL